MIVGISYGSTFNLSRIATSLSSLCQSLDHWYLLAVASSDYRQKSSVDEQTAQVSSLTASWQVREGSFGTVLSPGVLPRRWGRECRRRMGLERAGRAIFEGALQPNLSQAQEF